MPEPVRPITPDEATSRKAKILPPVIFEVFNDLITAAWVGSSMTIRQEAVVAEICRRDPSLTRERILEGHMLDVEPAYRSAGWLVEFDKPDHGGPGWFIFNRRRD